MYTKKSDELMFILIPVIIGIYGIKRIFQRYSSKDLDKPLKTFATDVVNGKDAMKMCGLSSDLYCRVEQTEFKLRGKPTTTFFVKNGFRDHVLFHDALARSHVYHHVNPIGVQRESLRDAIQFYIDKAKRFYPCLPTPVINLKGGFLFVFVMFLYFSNK